MDFPGAVVLITHDRSLIDRVSTVLLGLDGAGGAEVYADYAQWEEDFLARERAEAREAKAQAKAQAKGKPKGETASKKLSFKEQREYDTIEETILAAETAVSAAKAALEDPAVATDGHELARRLAVFQAAEAEVERLYMRWGELSAKLA